MCIRDSIYLDHILVDYEYVQIFFLCKDDECQYYLALCTDIENGCLLYTSCQPPYDVTPL